MFDADGRTLASAADGDEAWARGVGGRQDLEAQLHGHDGRPVALGDLTDGVPALVVDEQGRRLEIVAEDVDAVAGGGPETVVRLVPVADAPEALVQRALGGVLAHELRTPLTTIYGGAQLVTDRGSSEATRDEAAAAVAREAQRLLDVVEDLVILARFEHVRATELEPVLLQRLLPPVVASERVGRSSVTIETELRPDLPAVLTSPRHAEHAFRNVLVSAIRSSPEDSTIHVQLVDAGAHVHVAVADEGPVLAPAEADRAFELFARSPRTAADPSGVNLGLFVVARLVTAMGGVPLADATPSGMRVGFALPIADGHAERATSS